MGDLDRPYLDAALKAYADALADQLRTTSRLLPPTPPLSRRRRAWLRITRRPRAIRRRVADTWNVLLHGLPESDW